MWLSDASFKRMVEDAWKGFQVNGRGTYVLKEKLKLLKEVIKKWNTENFGHIDNKISGAIKEINELDKKDEVG